MDHWILEHCQLSEIEDYRRAMLRVFLGERIGGTAGPLKRFSDDLEPFGLSRDAVLRIYDAIIKAFVVTMTVSLVKLLEGGHSIWVIALVEWATAGLNLWARLKAYICVQYPALSLRVRSPTKSPPHLHQPLNHQIQLGNFNIWASYLVVYDL